jgi:hypothetical protein
MYSVDPERPSTVSVREGQFWRACRSVNVDTGGVDSLADLLGVSAHAIAMAQRTDVTEGVRDFWIDLAEQVDQVVRWRLAMLDKALSESE